MIRITSKPFMCQGPSPPHAHSPAAAGALHARPRSEPMGGRRGTVPRAAAHPPSPLPPPRRCPTSPCRFQPRRPLPTTRSWARTPARDCRCRPRPRPRPTPSPRWANLRTGASGHPAQSARPPRRPAPPLLRRRRCCWPPQRRRPRRRARPPRAASPAAGA